MSAASLSAAIFVQPYATYDAIDVLVNVFTQAKVATYCDEVAIYFVAIHLSITNRDENRMAFVAFQ